MATRVEEQYELIANLGRGTVAEAHVARIGASGDVVLKLLLREMALEPQLADRFLLAAKRASQVIHPDVARVCNYGTTPDGSPFVAFERAPGTDLKVLALNHRLSTNCAVDIIARLLSAVQACHARGLLHRDIKPRNVIVHLEEATATVQSLKLTDVGLTEALCEDEACAEIVGWRGDSLRYMAPERAAGLPVDERSDLYSVGVLLYELLAGVSLIDETDEWRALEAVRNGRWQRLAQSAPHLPPALIAVVEDALSVDPELRPRSAAAFARQLSPFISQVANAESETNQRFAPSYCPSNALSKVPQPHHDSACPGDLLLAPTFPRSPPAPRLEALQGDACAHISQTDSSGRLSRRARRIGWFVGVSFGLGLILVALDTLS